MLLISVYDPGVQIVFILLSLLGGGVVNLILPGLFYLKALKKSAKRGLSERDDPGLIIWAYLSIIVGALIWTVSFFTLAFGWI